MALCVQVGGQAPEGLDPLESSSRQVAYDWMHHHPTGAVLANFILAYPLHLG